MNAALGVAARRGEDDARRWLAIDPRLYRYRTGQFFIARRVTVAGAWTPLVVLRARRLRAADGGTEI